MEGFLTCQDCFVQKSKEEEEEVEKAYKRYEEIIDTLPRTKGLATQYELRQYKGFWFHSTLKGMMWVEQHFNPRRDDVFLITTPKSGTTWLKALIFTIINRTTYNFATHPLLTTSPHDCVPFLELDFFRTIPIADPDILPSPRVFATHTPFPLLPESIKNNSHARIVYICRNPKDVFVSLWHFLNKLNADREVQPISVEEAFEWFCNGVSAAGPFWDHVLENWRASLERPNKMIFLKYEDIKREPVMYVKRLSDFLGHPFSLEEEERGTVQQVIKLCSFETMRNLRVNKTGAFRVLPNIQNNVLYRKGKVGDWENYLTTEMIQRIDKITEEKLSTSGLTL